MQKLKRCLQCLLTYFCLNLMSILLGNNLLDGCRDEYITRLKHEVLPFIRIGSRKANNGSVFNAVVFKLLNNRVFT